MSITYKNGILLLNVLLIGMTLLSYCSSSVHPETSALIAVTGLVFPLLVILNFVFVFYWIIKDRKYALISLLILIVGLLPLSRLFSINLKSGERVLIVASFNCNFLKSTWAKNEDLKAQEDCIEFLESLKAVDVFCLQEYGERSEDLFEQALQYPYKYRYEGKTLAIYSKHPIRNSNMLDIKANAAHSCIWVDVEVPQVGLTRIYNVHMQSNRHDGQAVETIVEDAPEKVDPVVMTGLLRHYQKFSAKRVEQAEIIQDHSASMSYPYLVCGDMNDTPQSYMYQVFASCMKDAFLEAGNGFGFSYSGGIPFLRLDYIFMSEKLETQKYESFRTPYSDHDVIVTGVSSR